MANTGPTTGTSAGQDTNLSGVDYALEPVFGQAPSGLYTPLRFTSCTLAPQDSESTPDEINGIPEVAQSVLTSRGTSGSIGGILSAGTFEDMLAGVFGNDFISGTITGSSSTTAGYKYALSNTFTNNLPNITVIDSAQIALLSSLPFYGYIYISDPDNGINNFFGYSRSPTPGILVITSAGAFNNFLSKDQAAGPNARMYIPSLINGSMGKTFTFRKNLLSQWELYTGTMINQIQIQLQQGQPATIDIDLLGSGMSLSPTDISSSVAARTKSPLIDTVDGFMGCTIFGETPAGCIRSATITFSRDGSGQDYGMGHTGACGLRFGSFKAAMELEYFFKSYDQFTNWANNQTGLVSVGVQGSDGVGYQFAALKGIIRNPKTPISGKNQTVVATVSVTCNPQSSGGTFAIYRTGV
ncbi:phage major capsid protein HK97 [Acetobacter pasteurianus NBRC 101655]|uniref:phage tail tube protein n=1 Tax=Acetobacter pasteurianus TaxID=438 RepID=UPI00024576DC|nr:phage tail tube protein [Acetobacter pasteurianus]BAU39144.1 phage major capsid protein HK97 [Acetobacter pasteurianus NBRC 101655]